MVGVISNFMAPCPCSGGEQSIDGSEQISDDLLSNTDYIL